MKRIILLITMTVLSLSIQADIFIVGGDPFGNWDPNNGMKMENNGDGTYTIMTDIEQTTWFVFADALTEDWLTFNNEYRYSPISGKDETVNVGEYVTTQKSGNGDNSYKLQGPGTYFFTFDMNNMRFIVENSYDYYSRWTVLQDGVYWNGRTLYICSNVTSLGDLQINPTSIYSFAPVPPSCTDNTFIGYDAWLYMPAASYGAYFIAEYWSSFFSMSNTAVETTGLTLNSTEARLSVSETFQLSANIIPGDASYREVFWKSTNPQVAQVDMNGKITAQSIGECDIIASCVYYQDVCHVIVEENSIVISLDKHDERLLPNHALTITPTMSPQETALKITVSDPNVAAARLMNGVVQVVGLAEGITNIVVSSEDGMAIPDTCIVTVYTEPGDVDCDGYINISDVTRLIDYLLSGNPEGLKVENADTDRDGKVNISDVTTLIDYLLSGRWPWEHGYVDLGLPSGTLWATCNIGASRPEEYGNYFAWGETAPKENYNWSTYKWCSGNYNKLTKYCTNSSYGYNGFVDNKEELEPEDDAAYVNWGSSWRMPSHNQLGELKIQCTWTWTTRNGVNGYLVAGPNGNTLFLPAAGFRYGDSLGEAGAYGICWSRQLYYSSAPFDAIVMFIDSEDGSWFRNSRANGLTVRAVRVPQN